MNRKKLKRMFEQPEYHRVLPIWFVAHRYGIVSGDSESQLKKIVVEEVLPVEWYVPFQEPELFLSFARLASRGKPSNESILGWVNKYGLLCKAYSTEGPELPDGHLNQAQMAVEDFVREALAARSALDLYTDLSEGGTDAFRKSLKNLRRKYERMEPLSPLDTFFVETWGGEADKVGDRTLSQLDIAAPALLQDFVSDKVKNVRLALDSDYGLYPPPFNRYKPKRIWECPDLISAIYLQLYLWMTEGLPMRRCVIPTCRTSFPLTRNDKQVCGATCRSNLRHYPHLQSRR